MGAPICAPCDHGGDGVTWTDFHDHLMTRAEPPARQVFDIEPAYTGNAARDEEIVAAYAARLPVTSAIAANRLLTLRLAGGEPVARLVDFDFYFLAEVE